MKLEEVKQELEDEKAQQRDKSMEEITLVKKLCFLRQESGFCRAKGQLNTSLQPTTTDNETNAEEYIQSSWSNLCSEALFQ